MNEIEKLIEERGIELHKFRCKKCSMILRLACSLKMAQSGRWIHRTSEDLPKSCEGELEYIE